MEERSFPTAQKALNGSSANSGALGRKTSSKPSVTDNGKDVKKYSPEPVKAIQLHANKSIEASAAQQPNQKVGIDKAANTSKNSILNSEEDVKSIKENTADELDLMKRDQIGGQNVPARRGASENSIRSSEENVKKNTAKTAEKFSMETEEDAEWQAKVNSAMTMDEAKRFDSKNEDIRYSREQEKYDYSKPFAEQVDDWKQGKIPKYDTLIIGATPTAFRKVGFNSLPMTINQSHVDYAINGTKNAEHHIGEVLLKQLPSALEQPVAIIASETQKGTSVIALLPFTKDGKTVVAPVYIDGFGIQNTVKIDSNAVTSIYGRKNAVSNLLTKALNDHKLSEPHVFYLDKAKAAALYQGSKVTMPKMPNTSDGFVSSIRDANSPVKPKIKDITESQQFKRWFGKSKVVNDDGTPRVVYHATYNDFTVFDRSKLGENTMSNASSWEMGATSLIGHWFSDHDIQDELGATRLGKYYLNIEAPYEISLYDLTDDIAAFADNYNELEEAFENRETESIREVVGRYVGKLRSDGYDGLVVNDEEFGGTSYVVFGSEQIKSADPVTYNDNDEVIPLSKRFDRKNEDIRYSREVYWKPKLSKTEWSLLNDRTAVEIASKSKFLDEATKWLYAKKKGTEVFAIYGIGDGTVPTVLYASGGKKAKIEAQKLTKYLEGLANGTVESRGTFAGWLEAVSDAKREYYSGYDANGHRGKALGLDNILSKHAERLRNGDNDGSTENSGNVNYSREPETLNELRRQNKVRRERVEYWKRQTKPTKVKQLRMDDIRRLAKEVVSMSETDLKPKDITEGLTELGKYLLNEPELRYTDVSKMAEDIAADVIENATVVVNEEDTEKPRFRARLLSLISVPERG